MPHTSCLRAPHLEVPQLRPILPEAPVRQHLPQGILTVSHKRAQPLPPPLHHRRRHRHHVLLRIPGRLTRRPESKLRSDPLQHSLLQAGDVSDARDEVSGEGGRVQEEGGGGGGGSGGGGFGGGEVGKDQSELLVPLGMVCCFLTYLLDSCL
ncbi:unnamed protein product [Closterium sp. NIES-53]